MHQDFKEYVKVLNRKKNLTWKELWINIAPQLKSSNNLIFWKKLKDCTKYNINSGKSIVKNLKLDNGDLASSEESLKLIFDKYFITFDG